MDPFYKPEHTIEFHPGDWAVGASQLNRYSNGELVASEHDHMCAIVVLAAQTEFLVQLQAAHLAGATPQDATTEQWVWDKVCTAQTCTLGAQQELADSVGFGDLYRSTQQVARELYNGSIAIDAPIAHFPKFPPGGVEDFAGLGALPAVAVYALALTGAFGMAAIAWWGTDKNDKQARVDMHAAELATQLAQYQAWLDDHYRRGEPAPEAPPLFQAVSAQASQSGWLALAAGVVLGGLGVVGVQRGVSSKAVRRVTRRENPPRARQRRAPVTRRRITTTKRKRNPKRASTHTPIAIEWGTIELKDNGERIGWLPMVWVDGRKIMNSWAARGFDKAKAEQLAKREAKDEASRYVGDWDVSTRKRNPRKKTTRKKAPARKRNAKKTTRKRLKVTTKKKAPARKRNAKKVPAKGTTERSRFLRSQMAKGRSRKQAEAAWKGKARLQRINKAKRPKAKRRRRAA